MADWIMPDWPAPETVMACCTTRNGGHSEAGCRSFNLATHVEDDPHTVELNRQLLIKELLLPGEPRWLEQVHSTDVVDLDSSSERRADAALTSKPGTVAVVMTADCLPALITNTEGSEVAAAHAGWRGLLNGILEKTVTSMKSPPDRLMVWLGPAIGPDHFEVGEEVFEAFARHDPAAEKYFKANRPGHYLADLYGLARQRLNSVGIDAIYGGNHCTFRDEQHWFSYRRNKCCGRQASLIYIKPNP